MINSPGLNEQYAAEAFGKQSVIFDDIYASNAIVDYKRKRVREHVLKYIRPNASILELNSGTGEDAIFFAKQGFKVHATDISEGMQQQLSRKVQTEEIAGLVTNEICSFTQLEHLANKGPFDHIFSNFAGLNCTGELDKVLSSFNSLLNPDGVVSLIVLTPICLWELLLIFKGKFKTATRRLFSKNGRKAHLEGVYFNCWYYKPSYIINQLKNSFDLLAVEGLCTIVPPSYIEGFAEKYPIAYRDLKNTEEKFKSSWPWKYIGDYYIISLKKKA